MTKTHTCKVCDKSFFSGFHLKRHSIRHAKEKIVFCNRCHKGFTRLTRLIEHKKKEHSSAGAHSCRVCAKRFDSLIKLKRHGIVHIADKPYECDVCKKGFNTLKYLKQHTKVMHLGFRPHSCELCGEHFRSTYVLKKHLDEKHPGKNPHICKLCERTFIHSDALIQHKRVVHKE